MTFLAFGGGDTPDHIADFISYYGLPDVPTVADEDGSIRSSTRMFPRSTARASAAGSSAASNTVPGRCPR